MKGFLKKLFKATPESTETETAPVTPVAATAMPELVVQSKTLSELQPFLDACSFRPLTRIAAHSQHEGLRWIFSLPSGLDAAAWRVAFLTRLSTVPKRPHFPEVERLRGYADFQKGQHDALAVTASGQDVIFDFDVAPTVGFAHALTQTGLACWPAPFREHDGVFVSAGGDKQIRFAKADAPSAELFVGLDLGAAPAGYTRHVQVPYLGVMAIRPSKDLQNQRLRQIFVDQVRDVLKRSGLESPPLFPTPPQIQERAPHPRRLRLQQALVISSPADPSQAVQQMEALVGQALNELGWPFRIERQSANADIRLLVIDAFDRLENWRSEFLFLSPLGPALPDPSSRVRQASRDVTLSDAQFAQEFFQAVYDDAAVLGLLQGQREVWVRDDLEGYQGFDLETVRTAE